MYLKASRADLYTSDAFIKPSLILNCKILSTIGGQDDWKTKLINCGLVNHNNQSAAGEINTLRRVMP